MNDSDFDIKVAQIALGQVACEHWHPISLGMAGGACVMLDQPKCPHKKNGCYAARSWSDKPFVPSYSSNHEAAFSLVALLPWATVVIVRMPSGLWSVTMGNDSASAQRVEDASLPRAICLTALKAAQSR